MIRINPEQKFKKLNNIYNQIGFLAQVLLPLIDELKETTEPKHQFKKACNDIIRECEKAVISHFKHFQDFGKIPNPNGGNEHEAIDIYNVTAKAYDEAFEMFTTRTANEIVSIMEIIKTKEREGLDLSDISINYTPILK